MLGTYTTLFGGAAPEELGTAAILTARGVPHRPAPGWCRSARYLACRWREQSRRRVPP